MTMHTVLTLAGIVLAISAWSLLSNTVAHSLANSGAGPILARLVSLAIAIPTGYLFMRFIFWSRMSPRSALFVVGVLASYYTVSAMISGRKLHAASISGSGI